MSRWLGILILFGAALAGGCKTAGGAALGAGIGAIGGNAAMGAAVGAGVGLVGDILD